MPRPVLLLTAFFEGLCVLLIEIVGARAMAPYFGTSLTVWTAQITATLLFLALGYRFGGSLSRRTNGWHLPLLFGTAGIWLLLYRLMRVAAMSALAGRLGIAVGSFASAAVLFGPPLVCLGAVSPVLIAAIDRSRPGAGSAAGSLFFTNTIGGLAGGWATAFLVIPYLSVTTAISTTGAVLLAVALFWTGARRGLAPAVLGLFVGVALGGSILAWRTRPLDPALQMNRVVYERESGVGTLQVIDYGFAGRRGFLVDGVMHNQINTENGRSYQAFADYLDALSYRYAPEAKRALVIGLGAGVLPRLLARRGVQVKSVDIEPRIEEVARRYFGLPDRVEVVIADGRTFLQQDDGRYDLILLDVFAGESAPWHLITVEAFQEMAAHLAPQGRLLINTVTTAEGNSSGLARLEASLLRAFPEVLVFLGQAEAGEGESLTNAIVVAGADLSQAPQPTLPAPETFTAEVLAFLQPRARPGRAAVEPVTDDWSDVDYADARLRARWRALARQVDSAPPAGS